MLVRACVKELLQDIQVYLLLVCEAMEAVAFFVFSYRSCHLMRMGYLDGALSELDAGIGIFNS